MVFINDTQLSLRATAALVNTLPRTSAGTADTLIERADLDDFLADFAFTGAIVRDDTELQEIRAIRPRSPTIQPQRRVLSPCDLVRLLTLISAGDRLAAGSGRSAAST